MNGIELGDKYRHRFSKDVYQVVAYFGGFIICAIKVKYQKNEGVETISQKPEDFWTIFEEV